MASDEYEGEGFFDEAGRWWPNDAEWCDYCQGMGTAECLCAGDFCCCSAGDNLTCPRCDGEGYYVPTAKEKVNRAALRAVIAESLGGGNGQ